MIIKLRHITHRCVICRSWFEWFTVSGSRSMMLFGWIPCVVWPHIMTVSEPPIPAAPFQRSVIYFALLWSVLAHMAALAYFDFDAPRQGQAGLGHYISARLVNRPATPTMSARKPTQQPSPSGYFRLAVIDHSSFKVKARKDKAHKPKTVTTQHAPAPTPNVDPGNPSPAGGDASYESLVLKRIDAQKQYPYLAWRNRIEGKVDINLFIDRYGSATVLAARSDSPALAEAARAAIFKAQPLPIPPGNPSTATARIRFSMEFTIRN
jgi:TonB family protein